MKRKTNKNDSRLSILYEGRVQGVGFRYTVVSIAQSHPVVGYVQNLPDGNVLLVAEGGDEDLMTFSSEIAESHLGRFITNASPNKSPATGEFDSFQVRY